jgi:PAS domain S-box-containing protein
LASKTGYFALPVENHEDFNMKEIIVEHERSKTTKSIKRLLLAFFSAILITEGTTQWATQTFELLPQWAEYVLYPTLFLCVALPNLYFFGGRPLAFLVDMLTKSGRTALNTAQLLNNLISTSSVILFAMRVEKGQLYLEWVSKDTLESLLGYTEEEAMQPGWWAAHLHPLDRAGVIASSDKVFQGVPVACDYRFMHKNGSVVWIHDEQKLVLDNSGRPTHMMCTWSDITARKMTVLMAN